MRDLDSLASAVAETVPSIVLMLDSRGRIEYANSFFEQLTGYSLEEVRGRDWFVSFLPERDRSRMRDVFARTVGELVVLAGVCPLVARDGNELEIEWYARAYREGGQPTAVCVGQDVTKRRDAERECRVHSQVLSSISEGVHFLDAEGFIRFANPASERIFGYGAGELLGQHMTLLNDASPEENQRIFSDIVSRVALAGHWEGELRSRRKDGTVFHTHVHVSNAEHEGEPASGTHRVKWVSVRRDLSEGKLASARTEAALREKENLLREVHHRVKNNLQVISSLLHFHAKRVTEPGDLEAFQSARQRLLSMTLVHETLYQSEQLASVDMSAYVPSLMSMLAASFDAAEVRLNVSADRVTMPIELAVPCGMLLTELATNVFRHAFPVRRSGELAVSVRQQGARVVLEVDDDGVGFPDGVDPTSTDSFGLHLVKMLVQQLDGELRLHGNDGTHVHVSFPGGRVEAPH